MKELLDKYEFEYDEYCKKEVLLRAKVSKYERLLDKAKKEYNGLDAKYPKWSNVVRHLAEKLKEKGGFKYIDVLGPFGMNQQISIWLGYEPFTDKDNRLVNKNIYSLNLRPTRLLGSGLGFLYETGVVLDKYPVGSIADLNGENRVCERLPMNLDEIYKLIVDKYNAKYHD